MKPLLDKRSGFFVFEDWVIKLLGPPTARQVIELLSYWVFLWRGRFQVWGIGYFGIWIGLLAYLRRGRVFIGIEMV